jgi:hypothetical protein
VNATCPGKKERKQGKGKRGKEESGGNKRPTKEGQSIFYDRLMIDWSNKSEGKRDGSSSAMIKERNKVGWSSSLSGTTSHMTSAGLAK